MKNNTQKMNKTVANETTHGNYIYVQGLAPIPPPEKTFRILNPRPQRAQEEYEHPTQFGIPQLNSKCTNHRKYKEKIKDT